MRTATFAFLAGAVAELDPRANAVFLPRWSVTRIAVVSGGARPSRRRRPPCPGGDRMGLAHRPRPDANIAADRRRARDAAEVRGVTAAYLDTATIDRLLVGEAVPA
jgi:hypothetical protein